MLCVQSMFEIYNEQINDLLGSTGKKLDIKATGQVRCLKHAI